MQSCVKCRFFRPWEPSAGKASKGGECRFNPPVITQSKESGETCQFPWVSNSEWCGKFEEKR